MSTTQANEPEHEEHSAHEHGIAYLTIASGADGTEIMLESPLANLVGFEHEPSTDADKQKMQDAYRKLEAGADLFTLSAAAGCELKDTAISEHWAEAGHGDLDVSWSYTCATPAELQDVTTKLFAAFPQGFQKIGVEWVTDKGASAQDLDKDGVIKLN